jgi:uncharacterized DUF497 family protein
MIEWDEPKRQANAKKHGVDFAAAHDFDWETAMVVQDMRSDYGETRFQALGLIGARLHMLVYTPRGTDFRIISLRRANDREVTWYEENR